MSSKHLAAPAVRCFVLASRLIPDLDGGFCRAVLGRARDLLDAGIEAELLTVDPGTVADHDAHRAEFVRRGELDRPERLRNLFDEAVADPSWLRAAARPGEPDPSLEYRSIPETAPIIELPVIVGDPDWHLSTAPVVVRAADGSVAGVLDGFGGLYRAWLDHILATTGDDRPSVVIIEARQLGELFVEWDSPAKLVHTTHTAHIGEPYTPDAPILPLWQRWLDVAGAFDAVVWLTAAQRDDVIARFGGDRIDEVLPFGVTAVATPRRSEQRDRHRGVMVNRLAPGKRLDHAVRTWRRVVDQLPDAVLDIYGEGPSRPAIEALIAELGLTGRVILHGQISDPDTVLDDPAVLLLTTAFEGQGLAVLEALAHGTPVVSYDVRYGPAEALGDGGGVLITSGDESAFADAVLRVLTDDELHARLVDEAHRAAQSRSRAATTEALVRLLADVAERPRRR
ncbi:glycosyltransferase [Microbacterium gorillae]|uniref:glycosyltransferase n=1 Tax=Microbacterium gorillae TaxID=1231063 RepID=UPI003D96E01C